jgi:hypothetical protein
MFCKPNKGARGDFAEIVASVDAFRAYIERVRTRYDAILLQPVIDGDEYRVFCIDGQPVFVTAKAGFTLAGDGVRTLGTLLRDQNDALVAVGISPFGPRAQLRRNRSLAWPAQFERGRRHRRLLDRCAGPSG